ncbi:MAG: prepilin-type N-terminal cleavage/methylation domain-containing protein [Deltaproteobacteria bacterium]|nr:prepilin-type N-terminal cleavage/methylation domain-containing protein [Deltaproteobacteria bacterium]
MVKENLERRENGFTLLEVLVAISILAVGLLAVASMQTAAISGNQLGYRYTESGTLAQDRLEWLMAQPYTSAALSVGTDKGDPIGGAPSGYTITYDVANAGGGINALVVTVKVTLVERGVTRVTQLTCLRPQLLS